MAKLSTGDILTIVRLVVQLVPMIEAFIRGKQRGPERREAVIDIVLIAEPHADVEMVGKLTDRVVTIANRALAFPHQTPPIV